MAAPQDSHEETPRPKTPPPETNRRTISEHWTTEPDGEVYIKIAIGVSGPASLPPVTVNDAFQQICSKFPDKAALSVKRKDKWNTTTFSQYNADVTQAAKSLISLGLEPHHGVCILGFNSPEWLISYLAGIKAGGISVGVYETNSKETCLQIAQNCRAQCFFCENTTQLNKILEVKDRLPNLKSIVQYIPEDIQKIDPQHREAGVLSWNEFLARGKDIPDYELSRRIELQTPGHCASIIYTSGTTGPPKGVMLSHDNLTWSAEVMCQSYGLTEHGRLVSYLPLSHIAAQMTDIISQLIVGHTVSFAQPDALQGSLLKTLKEVHPTLFLGVPRVWEKIQTAIELRSQTNGRLKTFVMDMAKDMGKEASKRRQQGDHKPRWYWLSNMLVFKTVRKDLGLDHCKLYCSGGAPLPRAVEDFFYQFDIPICQLYGMSESTAIACMNAPENFRSQAVGLETSGVKLKIDNPVPNNEGEIYCHGRNVFMGYLHNDAEIGKTIDEDGWLHSGDIGYVDNEGYYFITARSKEIIITKGGENIAPVPIEGRMLESMRFLSNVMVIGDNQPYLTMFVTIKCQTDYYGNPTDKLDPFAVLYIKIYNIGSNASTVPEVRADPKVSQYIKENIEHVNENDKIPSHVKNFVILPTDFSINGGELTPTMKMKRNKILKKYQDYAEQMYRE